MEANPINQYIRPSSLCASKIIHAFLTIYNKKLPRGSTQGATDILVDTVDIALFAGRTGPTGTVVPVVIEGRTYLPFRFLFNAFEYSTEFDLEREGNIVRVVPN